VSQEPAPAPRQGLAAWIVSGSLALVMLIGGAVAFNSGDKSAEEGNPSANQTVAPGGGHTSGPESTDPAQPEASTPAPPPVIDPTADPGTVGIPEEQQSDSGTTDSDPDSQAPVPGRDPGQVITEEADARPEQTGTTGPAEPEEPIEPDEPIEPEPMEPGESVGPTQRPEPGDTEPGIGGDGPGVGESPDLAPTGPEPTGPEPTGPGIGEPGTGDFGPMVPGPTESAPTDPGPTDPGPTESAPQFTDVSASWSTTGDQLRVGVGAPEQLGIYHFTVSVNDTPFTARAEVGDDRQVHVTTYNDARNPYTYDSSTRRLNGTFAPADFGYSAAVFPSGSTVRVSTGEGATVEPGPVLPQAPGQAAASRPDSGRQPSPHRTPTENRSPAPESPAPTATPTAGTTPTSAVTPARPWSRATPTRTTFHRAGR
jgi:hypothetical protein